MDLIDAGFRFGEGGGGDAEVVHGGGEGFFFWASADEDVGGIREAGVEAVGEIYAGGLDSIEVEGEAAVFAVQLGEDMVPRAIAEASILVAMRPPASQPT